jgi:hypothetical protein
MHGSDLVTPPVSWAHGDGGFRDNLGLMPLLARHVHNIIVFVNVNSGDYRNNDDIRSMFFSLAPPSGGGDKRENVVFEQARWTELMDGFDKAGATDALVYCGQHWEVKSNERFNVRAYDAQGVNICWVYPAKPGNWRHALQEPSLRDVVDGQCQTAACRQQFGDFSDFPWYATAFQNAQKFKPDTWHVLQLKTAQVNLLADVMAWSLANPRSSREILSKLTVTPAPGH